MNLFTTKVPEQPAKPAQPAPPAPPAPPDVKKPVPADNQTMPQHAEPKNEDGGWLSKLRFWGGKRKRTLKKNRKQKQKKSRRMKRKSSRRRRTSKK